MYKIILFSLSVFSYLHRDYKLKKLYKSVDYFDKILEEQNKIVNKNKNFKAIIKSTEIGSHKLWFHFYINLNFFMMQLRLIDDIIKWGNVSNTLN